jgi:hypothetical protein
MIDFSTFKELHPNNKTYSNPNPHPNNRFASNRRHSFVGAHPDTNLPTDDGEPTAPEIYLFPTHLPGFDLRRKKWGENLSSRTKLPVPPKLVSHAANHAKKSTSK